MQGKVANFVETEQLVELTAQGSSNPAVVSSFVQVRGSIPLLWSQIPNIKYKPTTRISPPSVYEPAFDNHINDLISSYQVSFCCRLIAISAFRVACITSNLTWTKSSGTPQCKGGHDPLVLPCRMCWL